MAQKVPHQRSIIRQYGQQAGMTKFMMSESSFFEKILAYVAENKRKTALEAELSNILFNEGLKKQETPDLGINTIPHLPEDSVRVEEISGEEIGQRLDAIYDEEPLGFEKDPMGSNIKMLAQDPLEEVNLRDGDQKRVTYVSTKLEPTLKSKVVALLKENKDCFAWDYDEMPGLGRDLVELKLPIKEGKKPIKQTPRRFAPEIHSKIKAEVERLLRCKFIQTTSYVEWIANIVHVIKKNGSLRVCIDFRDLNAATPKDEYPMPVVEMLVDSAAGFEYLSMLDGYSG